MTLNGKHVVVVGGSTGIGLAIARDALHEGALVTIVARNDHRLKSAKIALDNRVTALSADFRDTASLAKVFGEMQSVDHLVLAGSMNVAWGSFQEMTSEKLQAAFSGKLIGYVQTLQAALPKIKSGGSVLFFSGVASRVSFPGTSGLAAVNGAVTQMAMTLSKELAPIRVNVISPGLVDTPAYDHMAPKERENMYQSFVEKLPVGRVGKAEDISLAALMLLKNEYATGIILDIDGGLRA
jgi:NAD(P)-dependent dehydrogenase (short-subunit alcohol dehydrogenase family)